MNLISPYWILRIVPSKNVLQPDKTLRRILNADGEKTFSLSKFYTLYSRIKSILVCGRYTVRYIVQCNVYVEIESKREYEA